MLRLSCAIVASELVLMDRLGRLQRTVLQTLLTPGVLKIAQGKAFAKKWVRKHPTVNGALARVPGVDSIVDETRTQLAGIRDGSAQVSDKEVAELKKRKLITAK